MTILISFLCLLAGFGLWYLLYGATVYLNGGRSIWKCFYEDLTWFLPGGLARKANYLKKRIGKSGDGCICGREATWEYSVVREHDLYVVCARDVLHGRLSFLFMHVVIPLIPLSMFWLGAMIVSVCAHYLERGLFLS